MANTTNKQINKQINKFKIILHFGLIGLLGYLFIGLFLPTASGQTMSNQNYIIQTEKVNTVSNSSADAISNPTANNKPNPNVSEGVNFKIETGFEGLTSALPFSISLSSDIIDFGALSPTNPVIRTVDLSVNSKAVYDYSVLVFENEPLTASSTESDSAQQSKTIIPDTTCDNGQCGIENSALWINALTYGFGYRCDNTVGNDCDNSFVNPNFYKHFPDIANNDNVVSIMTGFGSDNKAARISYKINISGNQAQGNYNNTITYIAVPNY